MEIIYFLVPIAIGLGALFITAFVYASFQGQFDDLETPRHRILLDAEEVFQKNREEDRRESDKT